MTKIQKWPKCKKWRNGLSAEGAKADVRSALHSADDPPFFVFLSFSCIYVCCGSMCYMGSMWAQQSYSAVLHLHLWWYYYFETTMCSDYLAWTLNRYSLPALFRFDKEAKFLTIHIWSFAWYIFIWSALPCMQDCTLFCNSKICSFSLIHRKIHMTEGRVKNCDDRAILHSWDVL